MESVTTAELFLNEFSEYVPVQILESHQFCLIQYMMKEIHVMPRHYVSLEFCLNKYFILTHYKTKKFLTPQKEPHLYVAKFKFSC